MQVILSNASEKMISFKFFRQSDPPPPPKSQNVKMRNFCNGFEKMMMSTFKKLQYFKFGGILS